MALGARWLDRPTALVDELGADNALAVKMDVTRPQDNNDFIARTLDKFGRIDRVVANAGLGLCGGISDNSDAEPANMINVN
ncbi:MAG TPA: SDR family NAD(P)-dependent oxidoreductase [Cryobacterium sp.]|nr:SDR family NAD(P)-dependent oxidoreductase [Cryobacterium sp.]